MSDSTVADASAVSDHGLYRAVWRWHFYAGLFVLPFLILLAVTGAIYLLKDEINDFLHPELRLVQPAQTAPLPAADIVARALEAAPGELKGYAPSPAPDRSAQVKIVTAEAGKQVVYVNPYDGAVLGQLWDGGFAGSPSIWVVRKIHSLEYFGWVANRLIELVGCWAIVLVITGF
ncbi:MAG: PepSY domain-containing protein, partial [Rhodobacteraceae bacterium]|nr:PepSY domain-containing protein [Paracoccaceae bacterium]